MHKQLPITTHFLLWTDVGEALQTVESDDVSLQAGELLVEIEMATVCRSDLHTVTGRRPALAPQILGHEMVGRVIALGAKDSPRLSTGACESPDTTVVPSIALGNISMQNIQLGQRITWTINASCGECAVCEQGYPQKCLNNFKYGHEQWGEDALLSGGFASHIILRRGTAVFAVSDGLPAEVAAPANCATATVAAAIRAAKKHRELEGTSVLITGAGMLGLTATAMLSELGAQVIVSDLSESRLALAKQFGASGVMIPAQTFAENSAQLQAMRSQHDLPEIGVALELSGATSAVEFATQAIGLAGVVVLVGSVSPGSVSFEAEQIVRNLTTIVGVHNYAAEDLGVAISFLETHWQKYPFAELVSEIFPLSELEAALTAAANPSHSGGRIAVRTSVPRESPSL